MTIALPKKAEIYSGIKKKSSAVDQNTAELFDMVKIQRELRSRSQLGNERILIPDTTPIAANRVRIDEPP